MSADTPDQERSRHQPEDPAISDAPSDLGAGELIAGLVVELRRDLEHPDPPP